MNKEIERKFLVKGNFKQDASKEFKIIQAYISSNPNRTVRIRLFGQKAFITIKGASNIQGTTRFEWEKEISVKDAEELLQICEPGAIKKTRYHIKVGKHLYEVDEFHEENKGLVIAEIELADENEDFATPKWLGEEVTGDKRYYNSYISKIPFSCW